VFKRKNVPIVEKLHLEEDLKTIVSKVPVLQELEPDFFIDQVEEHIGYFIVYQHADLKEFQHAITQIRYNRVCKLFHVEQGVLFSRGNPIHIVRIFSGVMDMDAKIFR